REFVSRLAGRGRSIAVWIGEADALTASAVFGLLTQVLRRALRLIDGEPLDVRRAKIRSWLARHPASGGIRLAAVLGGIVGAAFEAEDQVEPGESAKLPSEQVRQAFLAVLRAECAVQPVVIVLDDLHWGDLPTIKLMYAALGALKDQPLMVLALARNKVH